MGKRDEMSHEEVPVVHPIIRFSEDHFKKNLEENKFKKFKKNPYRNPHKHFSQKAPKIEFADIVGLVEVLITQYFYILVIY